MMEIEKVKRWILASGLLVGVVASNAFGAEDEVARDDGPSEHYASFAEAKTKLCPRGERADFRPLATARGTTTFYHRWWGASNDGQPIERTSTTIIDKGGNTVVKTVTTTERSDDCPWGWHSGVKSRCGHLLSYPVAGSDFIVDKTFTYQDAGKVATGKYVRVMAVISAPNDCHMPTEIECYNIIKRLAETGFNGYQSLRAAAKMRFGCSDAFPDYSRTDLTVGLLCKNCRTAHAWPCVKPVWKVGQKRTR